MPRYKYNSKGNRVKIAEFDTSLMLTLKDVLPNDPKIAKKYLVKKADAPEGKLRDFYNTKDNSGLVRKIFSTLMKSILIEMAVGQCQFIWPKQGKSSARMYVGKLDDKVLRAKRKLKKLRHYNLTQTGYEVPYIKYSFSDFSKRQHLMVYLNKSIYKELVEYANTGGHFSKLPRELDYFLPVVYEEFSYIKEAKLKSLMRYCFLRLQWHLKRGEEVRFLDGDGEIRFFRPLGKAHDKVMREVVKKRLTRERNKRYESIS